MSFNPTKADLADWQRKGLIPAVPVKPRRTPPDVRTSVRRRWALTLTLACRVSEAEFSRAVIEVARAFGWTVAHFRPARVMRNGVEKYETPIAADGKGLVDLLLARDRVLFRELKSETGSLSKDQQRWRDVLLGAGADWQVWRPRDWESIEKALK